jgi:hypothetical protein
MGAVAGSTRKPSSRCSLGGFLHTSGPGLLPSRFRSHSYSSGLIGYSSAIGFRGRPSSTAAKARAISPGHRCGISGLNYRKIEKKRFAAIGVWNPDFSNLCNTPTLPSIFATKPLFEHISHLQPVTISQKQCCRPEEPWRTSGIPVSFPPRSLNITLA